MAGMACPSRDVEGERKTVLLAHGFITMVQISR